jgi:hypothetical protein
LACVAFGFRKFILYCNDDEFEDVEGLLVPIEPEHVFLNRLTARKDSAAVDGFFLFNSVGHYDKLTLQKSAPSNGKSVPISNFFRPTKPAGGFDKTSATASSSVSTSSSESNRPSTNQSKRHSNSKPSGLYTDLNNISGNIASIHAATPTSESSSEHSQLKKPDRLDFIGSRRPMTPKFSSPVWEHFVMHHEFDPTAKPDLQKMKGYAACIHCIKTINECDDGQTDPWVCRAGTDSTYTSDMIRHLKLHKLNVRNPTEAVPALQPKLYF